MPENARVRIAILDDYQEVALRMADWASLPATVEAITFHDTLADAQALARRLRGFQIIVSMRERTRFPAALLEQLADLRLIAATGRSQANIDLPAATRLGILVATTESPGGSTVELTWALILAVTRRIPQEDAALRSG
ncbi:MAG: D-2-hydroxyacid dehydrogenase family protein, partial [Chloroflexi bacterium]|nr:D-2-hydroxyacid dehydrogenase family protein [Chloroflexota bacterium]